MSCTEAAFLRCTQDENKLARRPHSFHTGFLAPYERSLPWRRACATRSAALQHVTQQVKLRARGGTVPPGACSSPDGAQHITAAATTGAIRGNVCI